MCKVDNCGKKVFANGFCQAHYNANRLANAPECSVDGCDKKSNTKGMCRKHYLEELKERQPECEVDGCQNKIVAHGLCDKHRLRLKTHGHLLQTRPDDWGLREKHHLYYSWSHICQMDAKFPMDNRWKDFWKFVEDVGDRPTENHKLYRIDNYAGYGPNNFRWSEIKKDKSKAEYAREWRSKNPDKAKNSYLRTKYGITLEDYNRMLKEQGGGCAICGLNAIDKAGALHVDHCHDTKKVRGILCSGCNKALGNMKDDVKLLEKAIEYLKRAG